MTQPATNHQPMNHPPMNQTAGSPPAGSPPSASPPSASPPSASPAASYHGPGRHRNLGLLQRFLSRAGSILLVIAALGVGNLILAYTPDVDESERPFLISGEPGEEIEARKFTATVLKTRTAGVIKSAGWEHDTQGIWIILRVRFEATDEAVAIAYAAVTDGKGRSFLASDRLKQPLVDGSRILQPGIGVEGDVAFEVPKDATGLTARFSDARNNRTLQAVPDIELPLGDAVWLNREPVTLEPAEVKP
jgi:hypothetical protein